MVRALSLALIGTVAAFAADLTGSFKQSRPSAPEWRPPQQAGSPHRPGVASHSVSHPPAHAHPEGSQQSGPDPILLFLEGSNHGNPPPSKPRPPHGFAPLPTRLVTKDAPRRALQGGPNASPAPDPDSDDEGKGGGDPVDPADLPCPNAAEPIAATECADYPAAVVSDVFGVGCGQLVCDGSQHGATDDAGFIAIAKAYCPVSCGGCQKFCMNKEDVLAADAALLTPGTPTTCAAFKDHVGRNCPGQAEECLGSCSYLYQVACSADFGLECAPMPDPTPDPTPEPEPVCTGDACTQCNIPAEQANIYRSEDGECRDAPPQFIQDKFEVSSCSEIMCDGSQYPGIDATLMTALIRGYCPASCGGCNAYCANKEAMLAANHAAFHDTPETCHEFARYVEDAACSTLYQIACASDFGFCPEVTAPPDCSEMPGRCNECEAYYPCLANWTPMCDGAPGHCDSCIDWGHCYNPSGGGGGPVVQPSPSPAADPCVGVDVLPAECLTSNPPPSPVGQVDPTPSDGDGGDVTPPAGTDDEEEDDGIELEDGQHAATEVSWTFQLAVAEETSAARRRLQATDATTAAVKAALLATINEELDMDIPEDQLTLESRAAGTDPATGDQLYDFEAKVTLDPTVLGVDASAITEAAEELVEFVANDSTDEDDMGFAAALVAAIEEAGVIEVSGVTITATAVIEVVAVDSDDDDDDDDDDDGGVNLGDGSDAALTASGDDGGMIAGIVVGVLVGCVGIGLVVWWYTKSRGAGGNSEKQYPQATGGAPGLDPASGLAGKV